MYSNKRMAGPMQWVLCYGMWILLSALVGVVAWYLHTTVLSVTALVIENPTLRPYGWSADSLVGVHKLSIFILGSAWLIVSMWLEGALRRSLLEGRFWFFVGRMTAGLVLIGVVCYGISLFIVHLLIQRVYA